MLVLPFWYCLFYQKNLKFVLKREVFVLTRSHEQHNVEIKSEEKIKETTEYEAGLVVFDDLLEYKQKATDQFILQQGDIKI